MKQDYVYERLSKSEREQLEQLEKEHPYVDLLTDAVPIRYGTWGRNGRGRDKWIEVGVEKGIKIGIEQGIEQEAMRMAAKLKSLGIEMNIILESTGLTREQIEKL